MSYAQKNHLEEGNIIISVTGRLVKLFDAKTKERPNKPGEMYVVQEGAILVDGDEVKVKMYGEPTLPKNARGKEITLKSSQGPKGISGLKYKPEDYFSKVKNQQVFNECIEVSEKAEIYIDGVAFTGQELGGSPQASAAPSSPSKPKPTPAHPTAPTNTLEDLLISIDRVHLACTAIVKESYPNADPETHRAYVASYFIEANRNNAQHLPSKYPSQPKIVQPEGDDIPW